MARELYLLTARKVVTIAAAGRHTDGGNPYLSVSLSCAKSWIFMYRWHGKQKEMRQTPKQAAYAAILEFGIVSLDAIYSNNFVNSLPPYLPVAQTARILVSGLAWWPSCAA
jgi:hypothetical protein